MQDISIGNRLMIEVLGLEEKLTSSFVGSVRGRALLCQLPSLRGLDKERVFQFLYPDNQVLVRYLSDGKVYGFRSSIISYLLRPLPLLFLTPPESVETHNLRKHKRVKCLFKAEARDNGNRFGCVVTDISLGGAQILMDQDGAPEESLKIGGGLRLSCQGLNCSEGSEIEAGIRRVSRSDDKLDIGLKFDKLPDAANSAIKDYITYASHWTPPGDR